MSDNRVRAISVLAVLTLAISGLAFVCSSDESDADVSVVNNNGTFVANVQSGVAEKIYLVYRWSGYGSDYYWPASLSVTGSVPGMTLKTETGNYYTDTPYSSNYGYHDLIKNIYLEGTPTTPGTYYLSLSVKALMCEGPWYTLSRNIAITVASPSYDHTVSYSGNGATSGSTAQTVVTDSNSGNSSVTLADNGFTKTGYNFAGWKVGNIIYQPGQTVSVAADTSVNAVAQWTPIPVAITSSGDGADVVVGDSFSRAITTDPSGATITFTGPNWLTLSGSTLVGTPSVQGDYTVTVNASNGVSSDSQSFTIHVVNRLAFESVPTGGILATPVI